MRDVLCYALVLNKIYIKKLIELGRFSDYFLLLYFQLTMDKILLFQRYVTKH